MSAFRAGLFQILGDNVWVPYALGSYVLGSVVIKQLF